MPDPPFDPVALMSFATKLASSPAMKKMSELSARAREAGLDEALVDALIPVLCKYTLAHQAKDRLKESAEFVALVIMTAAQFTPDLVKVFEEM